MVTLIWIFAVLFTSWDFSWIALVGALLLDAILGTDK